MRQLFLALETASLAILMLIFISAGQVSAQNFQIVHSFTGEDDGRSPQAGLSGHSGIIFGTTFGTQNKAPGKHCGKSCGTVFNLDQGGGLQTEYTFSEKHGANPVTPLLIYKSNLFGMTSRGGNENKECFGGGCGTVFKVPPNGKGIAIYAFCALTNCIDGSEPAGGARLVADGAGNIYGTTFSGGSADCSSKYVHGCGVVFRLAPDGSETVLYAFCPVKYPICPDGALPSGGLIADTSGNLYGTVSSGGAHGFGAVFKVTPDGIETILHSFAAGSDGIDPEGGLIADKDGNFYGTTIFGGDFDDGTVFKITPNGTAAVLYSFKGGGDGKWPETGVVIDKDGNLYGTTFEGGGGTGCAISDGCGTVFSVSSSGSERVLHAFCSDGTCPDGSVPMSGLFLEKKFLFGTTPTGGDATCGCGTIYKVSKK